MDELYLKGELLMTKEEFAEKLVKICPNKKSALSQHYDDYGELLGHIFFTDEISIPLIELLKQDSDKENIQFLCDFIEDMWASGTMDVINIVDVSILESLSDEKKIWHSFGKYISDEFKNYINNDVLCNNIAMFCVSKL